MSIRIDGTNTTANPGITGSDTDTGLQFGTNEVKIVTDGTERATVDSSGQVGVGLTSPSSLLHLKSTSFPQLTVERDGSGTQGAGIKLLDGSGDENRIFTTDSSIVFDTGASSTPLARFQSGGGISFGNDTAAANALDDYEEGTYTPTINTTTTPITGITYTRQAGYYTKIGNVCHVSMWITWSARTNTSGTTASISLPFASKNANEYRGAMHVSTENCTYNGYGFDSGSTRNIGAMAGTHLNSNVAYMELAFTGKNGGGWGSGGLSVNGLGASGGNMQLSGTYLVQ